MYETCNTPKNTAAIAKLYKQLKKTRRSKKARSYLRIKGFQPDDSNIGFIPKNYPGHHDKKLIERCGKHALLHPLSANGYGLWHEDCIVFPLRNKQGEICSLFGQSISPKGQHKPQYLSNRAGLYPGYPSPHNPILLLTPGIPEAALLCTREEEEKKYNILALCSNEGLTPEHQQAILNWSREYASGREGKAAATAPLTPIWIVLAFDPKATLNPALQQVPNLLSALLQDVRIIVQKASSNETHP